MKYTNDLFLFTNLRDECQKQLQYSNKSDLCWKVGCRDSSCFEDILITKPTRCWHMPLLCVQWKTPDGGQRNCPKHVEFYSKNKFERLVHPVSFIIRIYHDARSPERQIFLKTLLLLFRFKLSSADCTVNNLSCHHKYNFIFFIHIRFRLVSIVLIF